MPQATDFTQGRTFEWTEMARRDFPLIISELQTLYAARREPRAD